MKRKMLSLLLIASCVISMTACGGKENVKEVVTQEETVVAEQAEEEAVSEPTAEPTEEPTAEPTAEPTEEPTEEPAEEETNTEENAEAVKPAAEMPANLSDDIYDFQVSIDGTVYQFPMWYSEFEALGWEYDGDSTQTLSSNQYTSTEVWKKDGYTVYTSFANLSMNTAEFSESMVCGIKLEEYYLEDCEWDIVLPGGIQYGVSGIDDIKAAYGDPTSDYDGEYYYMMEYEYHTYNDIQLYVYKESGVLETIEIRNITELEGADNSVDPTVPDIVKNYQTPAELGTDLYSFNVELEGNLYTLPCPVSVFIANGFEIDEKNSDMEIAAGSIGWVDLKYNNQTLRGMVYNCADYATIAENCFMTAVETAEYGPKFDMTIPGGIKLGATEEEVDKAVADFNVEKENTDSGFIHYTIYHPNGSESNNYHVMISEGVVTRIEVENSELPEY